MSLSGQKDRLLSDYLEKAVENRFFPGCVLSYGQPLAGTVNYLWTGYRGLSRDRLPVCPDLVYDLASLTKIVSTTFLLMLSVKEGLIELESKLITLNWPLPNEIKELKLIDLLTHQSGLPAWRPYYLDKKLLDRPKLIEKILNEPKIEKIGVETLYSDLNFILLGFVLEEIWNKDLKSLFAEKIAGPLALLSTGFRPNPLELPVAPTEDGPRLGGPLDWPGVKVMGLVPLGRVHDDNAAFLGRAAGQAGLFGTGPEIWRVIVDWAKSYYQDSLPESSKDSSPDSSRDNSQEISPEISPESLQDNIKNTSLINSTINKAKINQRSVGGLVDRYIIRDFLRQRPSPRGPLRAAGFDLGQGPIRGARGHLGYTGGSIWWDPDKDRAFVLLTNRVQPSARGSKMEEFRRGLAELLWA
ncbi:MAG: beta-lactamase family protein [Deltaproteobacteria bacterium]|jgi:CubicO group peptidase (beta-lactamase class C family)|nr:beta-lactamase family protein [Deltaproteobacteria bacterium]